VIAYGGSDRLIGSASEDRLAPGTDGGSAGDYVTYPQFHIAPSGDYVDGGGGIDTVTLDYVNTSAKLVIDAQAYATATGATLADGTVIKKC
jgi:hypothetical protein